MQTNGLNNSKYSCLEGSFVHKSHKFKFLSKSSETKQQYLTRQLR